MGKTKPEESLCTLDVAVVVANNHHVVLVPGAVEIKLENRMNKKIRRIKVVRQIKSYCRDKDDNKLEKSE